MRRGILPVLTSFLVTLQLSTSPPTYVHTYIPNVLKETRDADIRAVKVTRIIQPIIEEQERQSFALFGAISYYTWIDFTDKENHARYFWIKIRYDEGVMHVKVKQILDGIEVDDYIVVEYRLGKTMEELLPFFDHA